MEISITVDKIDPFSTSPFLTLSGRKDPTVSTVYINGSSDVSTYPSSSEWSAAIILSPGENRITIQGEDVALNKTSVEEVVVELPLGEGNISPVFGTLDEYGLELGLPRLEGEKNQHYHNRLLDVEAKRGNASYPGLLHATARALSTELDEEVLTITVRDDTSLGKKAATNATLEIDPVSLWFSADEFVEDKEPYHVDRGTLTIALTKWPLDTNALRISSRSGESIPSRDWVWDDYRNEITFKRKGLGGSWIFLTYAYRERIEVGIDLTLDQLALAIADLRDPQDNQLFTVTQLGDTSRPARFLLRATETLIGTGLSLDYYPVGMFPLVDRRVIDSRLNSDGTFIHSQAEAIAKLSRETARDRWSDLVMDKDSLSTAIPNQRHAYLPRIWDARHGYWLCEDPNHTQKRTAHEDAATGHLCPVDQLARLRYIGDPRREIRSGIAGKYSLKLLGLRKS